MKTPTHIDFRTNTQHVPPNIPFAVQRATKRFGVLRNTRVAQVADWEAYRQAAHDVRLYALEHLDEYLVQVERLVIAAGGHVHWARDAAEARALVLEIAAKNQVKNIVKAKSMATEEIALNHALEDAGLGVIETDLGEYIVQLDGTGPSHIIGPAMHMTKEDIAELFSKKFGVDAPPDPRRLTDLARARLREKFLNAEMGITGANFIVAETGTVVLLTNEGNGRMSTSLPEVHVVVAGIDKVIADWDALTVLLKVLARNATGQKMSVYTTFITGLRRDPTEAAPREFHLILLDNGRTRILADQVARETLACVRCGACLNICPVYNNVGGFAYQWAYSGPIGAILSPQLLGTQVAGDLPYASSLCGACADICPVKIPIPKILLHLRHRVAEGDNVARAVASPALRLGARLGALALSTPMLYRAGAWFAKIAQTPFRREGWLNALPAPINRWTRVRPLPAFQSDFRAWWKTRRANEDETRR